MAVLPEAFEDRMKLILGDEYEAFARSLEKDHVQGLRFNTLKAGREEEMDSCGEKFGLRQIPYCSDGFIYDPLMRPGRHPYHDAGVYYIQEPSAMAAVELMDVRPGEKILDLCAAPGGKSTQIAAKLEGRGLLVSNEVHPARAKILSQNIERMGIRNAIVTQEDPSALSGHFMEYFDKILVDAPCSGEGMFRKDEGAIAEWSEENVRRCARRGQEILDSAASMLRPGGMLVYSTCTFEKEEDEDTVERFLDRHRDFAPVYDSDIRGSSMFSGSAASLGDPDLAMYRLWPHRMEGEGAFVALLKKVDESENTLPVRNKKNSLQAAMKDKEMISLVDRECDVIFNRNSFSDTAAKRLISLGKYLYMMPEGCPALDGLKVLRCGLCVGSVKKDHYEPSHALALTVRASDCREVLSLNAEGEKMGRYLSGLTLPTDGDKKGPVLICADEYSIGWGKAVNGVLKNHYPKGLRRLSSQRPDVSGRAR